MLTTRRTGKHSERRATMARARHRVCGGAGTHRVSSRFFLPESTQQVTVQTLLRDCLGAAVTLAGIAGWGVLLMLLGA